MKVLWIIPLLGINLCAQPPITPELLFDSMGKAATEGAKGVARTGRYITGTQTEEEKCNGKYWRYFQDSAHTIGETNKENNRIKLILQKNNIDYYEITKQRLINITIDENGIRDQSCSQEYFELMLRNEKNIKEAKAENEILNELMNNNDIKDNKIIFNQQRKSEKPKIDLQMVNQAIEEVR